MQIHIAAEQRWGLHENHLFGHIPVFTKADLLQFRTGIPKIYRDVAGKLVVGQIDHGSSLWDFAVELVVVEEDCVEIFAEEILRNLSGEGIEPEV
ncbi:hypothetical protein LXL04_038504 [Taraxacum kok-saghyz]